MSAAPIAAQGDRLVARNTHVEVTHKGAHIPVLHRFSGPLSQALAVGFFINGAPVALEGSRAVTEADHLPKHGVRFQREPSRTGTVRIVTRTPRFFWNRVPVARHGDEVQSCCDLTALNGHVVAADRGFRLDEAPAPVARRGWISLKLLDFRGQPLASRALELRLADGTARARETDAAGALQVQDLPPGLHHLDFSGLEVERRS